MYFNVLRHQDNGTRIIAWQFGQVSMVIFNLSLAYNMNITVYEHDYSLSHYNHTHHSALNVLFCKGRDSQTGKSMGIKKYQLIYQYIRW